MRVKTILITSAASLPEDETAVRKVEHVEGSDQLHHLRRITVNRQNSVAGLSAVVLSSWIVYCLEGQTDDACPICQYVPQRVINYERYRRSRISEEKLNGGYVTTRQARMFRYVLPGRMQRCLPAWMQRCLPAWCRISIRLANSQVGNSITNRVLTIGHAISPINLNQSTRRAKSAQSIPAE